MSRLSDSQDAGQTYAESDDQIRARCLFIAQLSQHIEKCERDEAYIEAEKCKERLQELHIQDRRSRILRLREHHRQELNDLEAVMRDESREREDAWRNKTEQFELKATEDTRTIIQTQAERRAAKEDEILAKLGAELVRPSKQLQDFRRAQQQLVKQSKYREAEQFKIKADALEQLEIQRRDQENGQSLQRRLQNFGKTLEMELQALQARLQRQRQALKEAQVRDFERVSKKQDNIKAQLVQSQALEMARLRKAPFGTPFIVDEEGNDLLTNPSGLEEITKLQKEGEQKRPHPVSIVKAYVNGVLTVRPGDVYFSENLKVTQAAAEIEQPEADLESSGKLMQGSDGVKE